MNTLDNRKEIDYICKDCCRCLFNDQYRDMGAFMNLCLAVEPFDFINKAHIIKHISADDCCRDSTLNTFYNRVCPYYINIVKLRKVLLAIKDGE